MTITPRVRRQMSKVVDDVSTTRYQLIRIPLTRLPPVTTNPLSPSAHAITTTTLGKAWTPEEHERFLEGLEVFPAGPWRRVAEYVGTKSARQVMTHAQKYRQKIARRARNLELLTQQQRLQAEWPHPQPQPIGSSQDNVVPLSEANMSSQPAESIMNPSMWDVVLDDLVLDWSIESSQVVDSDRLLVLDHEDEDENAVIVAGNVSPFLQELMQDVNNLPDELLLSESAVMLLAGEPSYPSWRLDEAVAFVEPPYEHHRHDDQRSVPSSDDGLLQERHSDFQIWFGE